MSYMDTLRLKVPPYQVVSRIMVIVIFIVSGTVIALVVGKRKKAQEKNLRLEKQLLQAQKMESLGTLAGGIAHDFNNILYGLIGYTDLCLDDSTPDTLLDDNLKEIRSGLLRAKSLVRQILAFSHENHADIEPIKVESVVNEVLKFIRPTTPTTIEIQAHMDVDKTGILGDPNQIHQVLMNLCTNAVHAMEEDGGTLKIVLDNVVIGSHWGDTGETGFAPGPYLKISVSDSGSGISPDNLDRVFDPFYTSKEQGKGTGMGLAVAHGIIKAHKGRILVESFIGRGTTFDIFLPLLENGDTISNQNETHLQGDSEIVLPPTAHRN